jgi:pentatricopeptide repeat protein
MNVYSKLIRACGRESLVEKIFLIFNTMPSTYKQNNILYYNSFMNGLYDQEKAISTFSGNNLLTRKSSLRQNFTEKSHQYSLINQIMSSIIFFSYDYCFKCYLTKKIKRRIGFEEILGGFKKEKICYFSTCNICLNRFQPL